MVRDPSKLHPIFTVSPCGVVIDHGKVKWAVACVQVFVRYPLFTQRSSFFGTGIGILNTAIAAADAVRHSSEPKPWRAIGVEVGPVVADLKSSREKNMLRLKTVKDTQERWFGADTVASSAVGGAVHLTTIGIPDVIEVEDVQKIGEHRVYEILCSVHSDYLRCRMCCN